MAADPEVTIICMDNSEKAYLRAEGFAKGQIAAIKFYCETIIKCNPENMVGIISMSSGHLVCPTSNIRKVIKYAEGVRYFGEADFSDAMVDSFSVLCRSPPNMKKRFLMFVGGPISLHSGVNGYDLKDWGIALDVVNFFSLNLDPRLAHCSSILKGPYRYARKDLGELVALANDNDNSHIVDIADFVDESAVNESSVIDILSNSILKKHILYLKKKNAAGEE